MPTQKINTSFSIDSDLLKKIDQLKEKENRSRNFIVNRLLEKALMKIVKRD